MKHIFILLILTICTVTANSQTNDIFKRRRWDEAKLKWLLQDTLSKIKPSPGFQNTIPNSLHKAPNALEMMQLQAKNGVYKIPLTGVYVGDNGRGDEIYAMQPDKMPCLVPGKSFASNMPVAGAEKLDKNDLPLLQKGEGKSGEKE